MKFNKFQIKAQCIRFGLVCCVLFFSLLGWGQTQWGPNALPVIDMSSGETSDELSIDVSGSYFRGFDQSNAFTPNLHLNIPLFSRWVNLETWYSIMDFYSMHNTQFSNALPLIALAQRCRRHICKYEYSSFASSLVWETNNQLSAQIYTIGCGTNRH